LTFLEFNENYYVESAVKGDGSMNAYEWQRVELAVYAVEEALEAKGKNSSAIYQRIVWSTGMGPKESLEAGGTLPALLMRFRDADELVSAIRDAE
jgi:hypothetical protein